MAYIVSNGILNVNGKMFRLGDTIDKIPAQAVRRLIEDGIIASASPAAAAAPAEKKKKESK